MRLLALAVAVMLIPWPVQAQDQIPSSKPATDPSTSGQAMPAGPDETPAHELPVSLDRIREALARPPQGTTLKRIDIRPDFFVRVEEKQHILEILSKLDFKTGPTPPGGLYAYEQQQQMFNKTDRPLAQPYAAFSGSELVTLAIEGLVGKYLGGKLLQAITGAQREGAERAARQEVAQAIADYCDAQPDGGSSLHLCTEVLNR
jgi:hypothetical protein